MREPGFYWVLDGPSEDPEIARWTGTVWMFCGTEETDRAVRKILSDRLTFLAPGNVTAAKAAAKDRARKALTKG